MLQGVGARFDFHMCKTLCDLRSVDEFRGAGNSLSFFCEGLGRFSIL